MHLTLFTDYGLRLAIYLGCHPGRAVSVETCAGGSDPVAEALSSVHEITVPSQWC